MKPIKAIAHNEPAGSEKVVVIEILSILDTWRNPIAVYVRSDGSVGICAVNSLMISQDKLLKGGNPCQED